MPDIFTRFWENLLDRTEGPMNLRFYIQPAMSLFFAIRAAIRDAKGDVPPYLWRFFMLKEHRKSIAKEGWRDVGKIFIIGIVLDIIYQLILIFGSKTQNSFYPLESVTVACLLAIVPYLLFRGPVKRVIKMLMGTKKPEPGNSDSRQL